MKLLKIISSLSALNVTPNNTSSYPINGLFFSFYSIVTVCGLIGNILVMLVIWKNRDIRGSSFGVYLFGLALADFSVALFCLPTYITSTSTFTEHPPGIAGDILCKTLSANNLLYYFELLSIFTLTVISIERYAAVCKPLSTYAQSTPKRAKLILCAGCLLCILPVIPNTIGLKYAAPKHLPAIGAHCVHRLHNFRVGNVGHCLFMATVILSFLLPAIIMIICFIKTKKTLTKEVNDIKLNDNTQIAVLRHVKRREKTLTTIILVTVSVFVFSTPFQASFQALLLHKLKWTSNIMQFTISFWISSCCINPFIYGFRSTLFRKGMKAIVCKASCFTKKSYSQMNEEWSN